MKKKKKKKSVTKKALHKSFSPRYLGRIRRKKSVCNKTKLQFIPDPFFSPSFSFRFFIPKHFPSLPSPFPLPFRLPALLPKSAGATQGPRSPSVRSLRTPHFQRSERSLHLTSRIAFFPFALRRYRSSFFSSATRETSLVLHPPWFQYSVSSAPNRP